MRVAVTAAAATLSRYATPASRGRRPGPAPPPGPPALAAPLSRRGGTPASGAPAASLRERCAPPDPGHRPRDLAAIKAMGPVTGRTHGVRAKPRIGSRFGGNFRDSGIKGAGSAPPVHAPAECPVMRSFLTRQQKSTHCRFRTYLGRLRACACAPVIDRAKRPEAAGPPVRGAAGMPGQRRGTEPGHGCDGTAAGTPAGQPKSLWPRTTCIAISPTGVPLANARAASRSSAASMPQSHCTDTMPAAWWTTAW